jgi:hypothetical protein
MDKYPARLKKFNQRILAEAKLIYKDTNEHISYYVYLVIKPLKVEKKWC